MDSIKSKKYILTMQDLLGNQRSAPQRVEWIYADLRCRTVIVYSESDIEISPSKSKCIGPVVARCSSRNFKFYERFKSQRSIREETEELTSTSQRL